MLRFIADRCPHTKRKHSGNICGKSASHLERHVVLISLIPVGPVYEQLGEPTGPGAHKSLTTAAQQKPEPGVKNTTASPCPAAVDFSLTLVKLFVKGFSATYATSLAKKGMPTFNVYRFCRELHFLPPVCQ